MSKVKKSAENVVLWRVMLMIAVMVLVFCTLLARAAYLQIIQPDELREQGELRSLRSESHQVQRGMITDRNNFELAVSVPAFAVWVDPKVVHDTKSWEQTEKWQALFAVLDLDFKQEIAKIKKSPKKRFFYLKRQSSSAVADYVRQLNLPGVYLREESKRFYPSGEIAAHLVGFTNIDGQGIEGAEKLFNQVLTGTPGERTYQKDAKGRQVELLSVKSAVPPKNIQLSIDQRLQSITYRALKAAVKSYAASSGSAVVVDVHTGEILAMANTPSFNPNNRANVNQHRFRNRAITDVFEPGSTMKPVAVLSALEFGTVKQDSIVDTTPFKIGGKRFADPRFLGDISLETIIQRSSNVGVAKLALGLPKDYFVVAFHELGLGEVTGSGLLGESSGMFSLSRRWSDLEIGTLSYGYGVAVTTLQLAKMYATLGAKGVSRPLSILKLPEPPEGKRVFSEKNTDFVVHLMESVVKRGGTAPQASVPGYRVAGKSGTAYKAIKGGYGDELSGFFAGVAPVNDPQIAIAVMINEPQSDVFHGGEVAGPVFAKIMGSTLQLYNIAPDENQIETLSRKDLKEDKHGL
nr:penicillin-binding transpeptidase domain-containing protein [Algicola sagamiensis]